MSCEQEWDLPIDRTYSGGTRACEAAGTYAVEFSYRCSYGDCDAKGIGVNTTKASVGLDFNSLCVEVFEVGSTVDDDDDDISPAAPPGMASVPLATVLGGAWAALVLASM